MRFWSHIPHPPGILGDGVGTKLGRAVCVVGDSEVVGDNVGKALGIADGLTEGARDGLPEGALGTGVGCAEGADGTGEGCSVGGDIMVGKDEG